MPPRSVQLETKSAALSSTFGRDWAAKLFGEDAVASLPILKAGKNRGQPKGFVIWRKALTAGYCRECQSPVQIGQLVDAWIGLGPLATRDIAMAGQWMGRVQTLAGSRSVLFQEARDRYAAEQTARAADWEIEKAEMHKTPVISTKPPRRSPRRPGSTKRWATACWRRPSVPKPPGLVQPGLKNPVRADNPSGSF